MTYWSNRACFASASSSGAGVYGCGAGGLGSDAADAVGMVIPCDILGGEPPIIPEEFGILVVVVGTTARWAMEARLEANREVEARKASTLAEWRPADCKKAVAAFVVDDEDDTGVVVEGYNGCCCCGCCWVGKEGG